jgi:copper chaperone CopZ
LQIKGVEKCDVNFEESKATIVYDNEKVTETEILAGLKTNTTFKYALDSKSNLALASKCSESCSQGCCKKAEEKSQKSFFRRLFGF